MAYNNHRKTVDRVWFRSFMITRYWVKRHYKNGQSKIVWCVHLACPRFNMGHIKSSRWLKKHGFKTTNPKGFPDGEAALKHFQALCGIMMLADGPREEDPISASIQADAERKT